MPRLFADEGRGEWWSLVTQEEGGKPFEIRMPATAGIAGHVYRTGEYVSTPDAYQHPAFNPEVEKRSGLAPAIDDMLKLREVGSEGALLSGMLGTACNPVNVIGPRFWCRGSGVR